VTRGKGEGRKQKVEGSKGEQKAKKRRRRTVERSIEFAIHHSPFTIHYLNRATARFFQRLKADG
jgi:hypothetical protein